MHQQLTVSRGGTTTVCFDIPVGLADRFREKASLAGETQDALLDDVLTKFLNCTSDARFHENGFDKRREKRVDVSINGVMEISMPHNETQYKAVKIRDISVGGLGMVISCDSSVIVDNLRSGTPFVVIFSVPSLTNIFKVLCRPVHVTTSLAVSVGASFVKLPAVLANTLQVHFGF